MINLCLSCNASATGRSVFFWHTQLNCYAGAVGLPPCLGWRGQLECCSPTAHSKQSSLFIVPQICMDSGLGICVTYSFSDDSLVEVAILLKYCVQDPTYFPPCSLLNYYYFFKLPCVPVCELYTITEGFWCLGETACLNKLLLKQITPPKACSQVAFGTKGCKEGDICKS